jgi:hypothetical protein
MRRKFGSSQRITLGGLGYRPQHPGIEGIKLAIREMILSEWEALQQEKTLQTPSPGDLSPEALKAAEQAGDAIARASAGQTAGTSTTQKPARKQRGGRA